MEEKKKFLNKSVLQYKHCSFEGVSVHVVNQSFDKLLRKFKKILEFTSIGNTKRSKEFDSDFCHCAPKFLLSIA